MVYSKSSELRAMFTETLNKVTQGYITHTPLKMIQVSKRQERKPKRLEILLIALASIKSIIN